MAEREFPGNVGDNTPPNAVAPQEGQREKKVEAVPGLGDVIAKKPSLGKRFKQTFVGGDAKSAWTYVWASVLVPTAKNMLLDAIQQGSERLVIGEVRSRPSTGGFIGSSILGLGHQAYNKMYQGPMPPQNQQILSPQARATHNFQEMVVGSRIAAETVIDRMFDLLGRDNVVTVASFYDLLGIPENQITYSDQQWGWVDLRGSQVTRVPQGYLLDIPRPIPLA